MKRSHLTAVIFLLLTMSTAWTTRAQQIPQWKDYPVDKIFGRRNVIVQLQTDREKAYRTRLREASHQQPNYAGHYVLTTWGCGTECVTGAAIDLLTGKVVWLPATICCARNTDANFEPVIFNINSRLIVLSGLRDEKEGDDATHFYSIEGETFVFVADIHRSVPQARIEDLSTNASPPAAITKPPTNATQADINASLQAMESLKAALKDPEKVKLIECMGVQVYENPQPRGHPPSAAECDQLTAGMPK